MLSVNHDTTVKMLSNLLSTNPNILWAITGTTNIIIQGIDIPPNDIDIITDKNGAYLIDNLLSEYVTKSMSFSSTDKIRSHFGQYETNEISIDVMGDVQKKVDGVWEEIFNLRPMIEYIEYNDLRLPVLNLRIESEAYKKRGHYTKANMIDEFLSSRHN